MEVLYAKGGENAMVKDSAKVFGYVERPLKERIARLRALDWRLTESRLIDEGLHERVAFYESQVHPIQPAQKPARRKSS